VRADGLLDRALVMEVPATVTFPLRLAGDVEFSGRAMLFPHDWRDLTGAVRASVAASHGDGDTTVLWADTLRAGDHGRPRGHPVGCQIPTSTVALHLSLEGPTANRGTLSRAVWVEPVLIDPHAPPRPIAPTPIETPSADGPLISVLTPVHDPPPHMLEEAIASVRNQTYANWQLCLVDDGSTNPDITTALQRHADADPRIHLTRHDTPHGISNATNAALNLATGDYIALLDHDDTLTSDALQHIADRIATDPTLDMLYTDEDVVADDGCFARHIKPGWSPDHMNALMYTCHLGVYRRTLAVELGGFQARFDGCQDYDLVLRLMERTDRIAHVPRILYHWRAHATSTASGERAKPWAYLAQPTAIAEHLERSGIDAEVQFAHLGGLHRIVHWVSPSTTVDLVVATRDAQGLAQAAATWMAQPHRAWRVVLAAPDAILDDAVAALTGAGIPETRITAVAGTGLSSAATAATAEHLLLMQTPGAGLTHDWLTRLLGYSAQAGIAAAGPVLLAPDGRIAQAGIAIPEGIPLHVLHGARSSMDVLFGYGTSVYNVSAVSGILATPRATYEQLGGLDPTYGELGLIHYCLRAADDHLRTVIVPDARLRTTGPDPTTNDLPTLWRLRNTWARTHTHDPYYNPSYRTDRGDFVLRRYD
jgi:O-antigen biosynthesis protein